MSILKSVVSVWAMFALTFSSLLYGEMPELPRGKGDYCVEPTDVMRKDHMSFLLHQRDETVIKGVRTKKHSLVGCIDCHVQTNSAGEFIPVNAPGQFCETCHTFTSVKLDCFECHATTPDKTGTAAVDRKLEALSENSSLEQELKRFIAHRRFGAVSKVN